jgi:UDP-glucose:(heptosyl)LPS alpha-1,3-glucosyltransferase
MMTYPRWAKSLSMALSARRNIPRGDFDVVQGFAGVPDVDVHRPGGGAERAWLTQELECREPGWERRLTFLRRVCSAKLLVNLYWERRLYGDSPLPLVVANSRKVERDLLRYHPGMDPRRIRVIPNGVDLERFHPGNRDSLGREMREGLGLAPGSAALVFVAHNFRLKGLSPLLEALANIEGGPEKRVLLVAGRGRTKAFEKQIRFAGITTPVLFLGAVRRPERLMAAGDVLVCPTFYDPFSNVCLEAMAAGLPVITTAQNGASELVEDGVSGYVLPHARSIELLGRRILELTDPGARERMGQAARGVAQGLSWDCHLARMETLYQEAAARRGLGG